MTTWLKNDDREIELNDAPETIDAAVSHGWKLKSTASKQEAKEELEALQYIDEMELPALHKIAKDMGQKMAANIGLEKAREKVKAMLEAE